MGIRYGLVSAYALRQRVSAEKGRYHRYRIFFSQPAGYAQHAQLGFEIQSVAGLYLHCGYPLLKQSGQSEGTPFKKRGLICVAGSGNRRSYSATLAGDFFIGSPL